MSVEPLQISLDLKQMPPITADMCKEKSLGSSRDPNFADRAGIEVAKRLTNAGTAIEQVLAVAQSTSQPNILVTNVPPSINQQRTGYFTVGLGIVGGAGAGGCFQVGAGVYGSNLPQFGVYFGCGVGAGYTLGGSGELEATVLFGPPTLFNGTCWEVTFGYGVVFGGHVSFLFSEFPLKSSARWIGFTAGGGISGGLNISLSFCAGGVVI